jgi:hypothetical protein
MGWPAYSQRDTLVFDSWISPPQQWHSFVGRPTAATALVPTSASIGTSGTAPLAHLETYQGE